VKCRNGLHEINPADPWRAENGTRCRPCYLARQRRYNESEKGRDRWLRYEEGSVGWEHRFADSIRKANDRLEGAFARFESEFGESCLAADDWERRDYIPKYNEARKTDVIRAKQRELGWDWVRANPDRFGDFSIKLAPVRPDAPPLHVLKEVIALYRMRPAERFTRRRRSEGGE
jgi:hypothetical protein